MEGMALKGVASYNLRGTLRTVHCPKGFISVTFPSSEMV